MTARTEVEVAGNVAGPAPWKVKDVQLSLARFR